MLCGECGAGSLEVDWFGRNAGSTRTRKGPGLLRRPIGGMVGHLLMFERFALTNGLIMVIGDASMSNRMTRIAGCTALLFSAGWLWAAEAPTPSEKLNFSESGGKAIELEADYTDRSGSGPFNLLRRESSLGGAVGAPGGSPFRASRSQVNLSTERANWIEARPEDLYRTPSVEEALGVQALSDWTRARSGDRRSDFFTEGPGNTSNVEATDNTPAVDSSWKGDSDSLANSLSLDSTLRVGVLGVREWDAEGLSTPRRSRAIGRVDASPAVSMPALRPSVGQSEQGVDDDPLGLRISLDFSLNAIPNPVDELRSAVDRRSSGLVTSSDSDPALFEDSTRIAVNPVIPDRDAGTSNLGLNLAPGRNAMATASRKSELRERFSMDFQRDLSGRSSLDPALPEKSTARTRGFDRLRFDRIPTRSF